MSVLLGGRWKGLQNGLIQGLALGHAATCCHSPTSQRRLGRFRMHTFQRVKDWVWITSRRAHIRLDCLMDSLLQEDNIPWEKFQA